MALILLVVKHVEPRPYIMSSRGVAPGSRAIARDLTGPSGRFICSIARVGILGSERLGRGAQYVSSYSFGGDSGSQAVADHPESIERELSAALQRAITTDSPAVGRLSYARTSVRFRVEGGTEPCTLLLDRRPPTLGGSDEPAEIEFLLSPDQAQRLARGELAMPEAVVSGAVVGSRAGAPLPRGGADRPWPAPRSSPRRPGGPERNAAELERHRATSAGS